MSMGGENSPEKNNSKEAEKQQEKNETIKEIRGELSSFQLQIMENVKIAINNVSAMFGNALASLKSIFTKEETPAAALDNTATNNTNASEKKTPEKVLTKKNADRSIDMTNSPLPADVQLLLQQPLMDKVKDNKMAFAAGLCELGKKIHTKPERLLAVMNNESGLNPKARNKHTRATGLIQFMPTTASGLGTSVDALRSMSNLEQLAYVGKYYEQNSMVGRMNSLEDVYLATFFPAAVGHSYEPWYVFETRKQSAASIAKVNPMFNQNKDGKITMAEFSSFIRNNLATKIDHSVETPTDRYLV